MSRDERADHLSGPDGRDAPDARDARDAPDAPDAPVRVLVVDDDPLVRSALTMVLRGADGVTLVGEATDGDEVPDAVARHRPDVVLMDIRMPRVDGLTALAALRRSPRAPEVVVLTTFDADEQVVRAVRDGAAGFLLKDTPPAEIVAAVRRVAEGEAVLDPSVTRGLLRHVAVLDVGGGVDRRQEAARAALGQLSERERDVAEAVARGLANAQIAEELYMSPATVKAYVSRLLARLGLDNRVQVALLVHDAGRTS
ncbi:response regulator transcription factor [Aquipuribacter sp. SD81]|uniref:response regulator transcription factor n=1 Tax=Aquipuribacter sp. SD81 TaxID=3127703 RepID=UPI003016571C